MSWIPPLPIPGLPEEFPSPVHLGKKTEIGCWEGAEYKHPGDVCQQLRGRRRPMATRAPLPFSSTRGDWRRDNAGRWGGGGPGGRLGRILTWWLGSKHFHMSRACWQPPTSVEFRLLLWCETWLCVKLWNGCGQESHPSLFTAVFSTEPEAPRMPSSEGRGGHGLRPTEGCEVEWP